MKRIYFLIVAIFAFAFMANVSGAVIPNVIPYLPPLQSFGGTSADLATFLPVSADYTLEVQGTVGVEISVAGGVLTYTPTTNGVVRFSQKSGRVYVYEGNMYKTTLTPVWSTTYPVIADATAHSDANNLLQNASFETPGLLVGGTNYNFGTPWTTNVTVTSSGGIRVQSGTLGNVNGTWECVWRGTGNPNYFSQQLTATIKPNTAYKIIINQLAGSNSTSMYNVGLGSTAGGLEYGYMPVVLANAKNGTWSVILRTPISITSPVYFTFKNTPSSTSPGGDPLTQIDYLALVEGTDAVTGITGVSSATFLNGTAYVPENVVVDYGAGDSYDMTSFIVNQSFEDIQVDKMPTFPGWTKTGAANTEYCTRTDAGPAGFKTGNVYFQYWSGAKPDYSISQVISGLPNGKYRLTVAAGGDAGTMGTYIYAGDQQTQVTATGDLSVEAVVANAPLTIGFKSVTRTVNWSFADNFRLYYLGEVLDPILNLSLTDLFFDPLNFSKTFTVSGGNLTENTILTVPTGIELDKYSLTPAEVAAGVTITATYVGSTAINNELITATSGSLSKSITVTASADNNCFTPLYTTLTNIITDPYCNSLSSYAGWGTRAIETNYVYCGARSIKFTGKCGGSVDYILTGKIQGNKTYRVKAMVSTNGTGIVKIGVSGVSANVIKHTISTNAGEWLPLDFTFTTQATITSANMFLNSCEVETATEGYIDNWEMYELPTITATLNDEDNGRLLFTAVGQTLEVPIVAEGFDRGLYISTNKPEWFELSDNTMPSTGGTLQVKFIGTAKGVFEGTLTVELDEREFAPGMQRIVGIGTALNIPMVADISTGISSNTSDIVKTFIVDNNIIAQFNLSKTSEVGMEVYNVNGMLITKDLQTFNAGKNQLTLKANLPSGVYFVKMTADGKTITNKLVK